MANVFINDPLLGGQANYQHQIDELSRMQRELEERKNAFMNQRAVSNKPVQPSLCDEIDKLTDALTDREFSIINENREVRKSQEAIASIMNREYLRLMRPMVEGTADGKEALGNHLRLLKSLKKEASRAVERNMELFNEYTEKYADMTYADFLKMKRSNN